MLILLVCVCALASCSGDRDGEEETEATTAVIGDGGYSGDITLAENGEAKIKIVYQSSGSNAIMEAVDIINSNMGGANITSIVDAIHDKADDAFELLIGDTKYDISKHMLADLEGNSYSIAVKGNKIVIVATNPYLYSAAAETLVSAVKTEEGRVFLPAGYSFKSESYDAISLGANGKSDYTIVYEKDNNTAYEEAVKIKTAFRDVGIDIAMVDSSKTTYNKEILVGKTGRPLSNNNEAYYKGAWIGKGIRGDIAIAGNVKYGASRFIEYLYTLGIGEGSIDMMDTMFGVFTPSGVGDAPLYKFGGTPEYFDSFEKSNSYYIIVHEAKRTDYRDYTELLEDEDYKRVYKTEANGNLFETWTDGYTILTMSHIAYYDPATTDRYMKTPSLGNISYMSIAVDCIENSALPVKETSIKNVTTEQITTVNTGAGYVLRLSDGRFIVFDGGLKADAPAIYSIIKVQNVLEGKPVIAAWFLTHGHTDHIEAMLQFMSEHNRDVEIQTFVHNLPAYELYHGKNTIEGDAANQAKVSNGLRGWSETYYTRIKSLYPKSQIIVAHAGQRFEYGGIDIDVLFTSENIYRKQMLDTNMSSVIYSVTGATGRMIILGDAVDIECPMLNAIYGSALKADLVQVHHHGYNGGNAEMYASIDADYAIWTNSIQVVYERQLYISSKNPRCRFDYKSVDYNLIPNDGGEPIILYAGMTREEVAAFDAGLPR